jgi:fructose-1-phosphate kinase PfkB-like protein
MTADVLVICANPLLNLVHAGELIPGEINRMSAMAMHAEGKGVNVGRLLARLGHRVVLTGFAGGHSGAWLRDLVKAEGMADACIDTLAPVRVGFMASSSHQDHPTSMLPNGFPVTTAECDTLLRQIDSLLPHVRLVIISGSVPDDSAEDLYLSVLALGRRAGVPCWLDAHGSALVKALAGPIAPDLAKPNREEYAQSTEWDRVPELHITDGGGIVEVHSRSEGSWQLIPPTIQQVNPIGSGDCYVAGLAHGWLQGLPLDQRLALASSAGAVNALRQDVAMILPHEIDLLISEVTVRPL